MKLYQVDLLVPADLEDVFTAFLAGHVSWGWEVEEAQDGQDGQDCQDSQDRRMRFVVYLEKQDSAQDLMLKARARWPDVGASVAVFEDQDWSETWKEFFVPVRVGKTFMVLPPWRTNPEDAQGCLPLYIEPKMAFGTGHHATTALCLECVATLWQAGKITRDAFFLDLGTGSGILALACARLGLHGLALDLDPVAVDNARENFLLNQVHDHVDLKLGGLEAVPSGQRFHLILANILARPLARMAPQLAARLDAGGILVLSGILQEQADHVQAAYQKQGLPTPRRIMREEWAALVWE